jgi:hypothetical protein
VSESLITEYRDALTIAAQALGASLTAVEKLDSDRKLVLRCAAPTIPHSVIVRQLLPNNDDAQAMREAWFFNEWAGLEFLIDLGLTVAPRVYASNPPNRLLVLEDLGDRPPLMNILQRGNPEEAAEGLERFLTLLGHHALLHGCALLNPLERCQPASTTGSKTTRAKDCPPFPKTWATSRSRI